MVARIKTCRCVPQTEMRTNPMTKDMLLLCERHAILHDDGISFRVWSIEDNEY